MLLKNCNYWNPKKRDYEICDIRIQEGFIKERGIGLLSTPSEETFDLKYDFLLPAFGDSHTHFIGTGMRHFSPPLDEVRSLPQLRALLHMADTVANTSMDHSSVIFLRGWDEEKIGVFLDRRILDSIEPQKEIVLVRKCGHIACVNSKAIESFHLEFLDGLDETNIQNGLIKERALSTVFDHCPSSRNNLLLAIEEATKEYREFGITCTHSDDLGFLSYEEFVSLFKDFRGLRIYEKIQPKNYTQLEEWCQNPRRFFQSIHDFLQIKSIKLFLDGSFGARTAYLRSPYEKEETYRGVLYHSQEELEKYIRLCEKKGISICLHVIGDAALQVALDAFQGKIPSDNPLRHRLIHVQMADAEQIKRLKATGLWLSIQPVFFESDRTLAPAVLGRNRYERLAYPFRELYEAGIPIALSTDSPVESLNPWENLSAASRFFPVREAFDMYTVQSAKSGFLEEKLGYLEEGFFADAILLSQDPFQMNEHTLRKVLPSNVLFHGQWCLPIS